MDAAGARRWFQAERGFAPLASNLDRFQISSRPRGRPRRRRACTRRDRLRAPAPPPPTAPRGGLLAAGAGRGHPPLPSARARAAAARAGGAGAADPALSQRAHVRHALRAPGRVPRRRNGPGVGARAGRSPANRPRAAGRRGARAAGRRRRGGSAVILPRAEPLATVVVCEDDEPTLRLLCEHLEADQFRALAAPSASDALRLCQFKQPDLLLLDLALPDAFGLDVLREIRRTEGATGRYDTPLPVIVLSGRGSEADRVRGFVEGADDYL